MLKTFRTAMCTFAVQGGILCPVAIVAVLAAQAASAQTLLSAQAPKEKKCTCQANTSADFYANPTVDRSSCIKNKNYLPTGIPVPAICSFPTMTQALVVATASLVSFTNARAILAGGTEAAPAVFASESFPLSIVGGITLTTTDDPSLGGGGFHPDAYVILFNSGATDHAITVKSNGAVSGFRLQNGGTSTGRALSCDGSNVTVRSVTLDGTSATNQLETGLLVSGTCAGTFSNVEARNFAQQGILVNSTSPTNSTFSQLDLHNNRIGLQVLGGNVVVRQTSPIPGDVNRIRDNNGTLDTIDGPTNNMGFGIVLGDLVNQPGVIRALIRDTAVQRNDVGILIQQTDSDSKSTHWSMFGNEIVANRAWGLWSYSSFLEPDPTGTTSGLIFSGNLIGNNGWSSPEACLDVLGGSTGAGIENYSQIVFLGRYPSNATLTALCSSFADNETQCNETPRCAFNLNAFPDTCQPAYDLSAVSCGTLEKNTITGYDRFQFGNLFIKEGIVAGNQSWVKVANVSWLTSGFAFGSDWIAIDPASFVGNGGLICFPAAAQCPIGP